MVLFSKSTALFAASTLLGSLVLSSGAVFAQSLPRPPLTTTQKTQAAQVARNTEHINTTNGYVSVSSAVLTQRGLSPQQISYVETTIRTYDTHYGLTATTPSSAVLTPMAYPPNTAIWLTYGNHTGQRVILYEGAQDGWGWVHMQYRHNWKNTAVAQNAVKVAVNSGSYKFQHRRNYDRNLYFKKFKTTIPFIGWWIELQVVVNVGNATGSVDSQGRGPGAVVTAFPIAGNYVKKTWHGQQNTSIVPWWINVGYYKPKT